MEVIIDLIEVQTVEDADFTYFLSIRHPLNISLNKMYEVRRNMSVDAELFPLGEDYIYGDNGEEYYGYSMLGKAKYFKVAWS